MYCKSPGSEHTGHTRFTVLPGDDEAALVQRDKSAHQLAVGLDADSDKQAVHLQRAGIAVGHVPQPQALHAFLSEHLLDNGGHNAADDSTGRHPFDKESGRTEAVAAMDKVDL